MKVKRYLLLMLLFACQIAAAQCYVDGSPTLYIGETQLYSVENNSALCTDCHHWSAGSPTVSLVKPLNRKSVKITGVSEGTAVVYVKMQTAKGEARCSKNISVLPAVEKKTEDCDVNFSGFFEKKVTDGKLTFIHEDIAGYRYRWMAEFDDDLTEISENPHPVFNIGKGREIRKISVQILADSCLRIYSKTYEAGFWTYF